MLIFCLQIYKFVVELILTKGDYMSKFDLSKTIDVNADLSMCLVDVLYDFDMQEYQKEIEQDAMYLALVDQMNRVQDKKDKNTISINYADAIRNIVKSKQVEYDLDR